MISSLVSRLSAVVLASGGLALLFAPDALLPRVLPGLPPEGGWLGQCIAAGWLSIALFNWNSRRTILGGIYGRPAVNLNLVLYLVTTLALLKAKDPTFGMRMAAVPLGIMALVYAALLLRGPFDRPAAG